MLNRSAYLSSREGGGFESDFIRFKRATDEILQSLQISVDLAQTENADPEIRKNDRGTYISGVKENVGRLEKLIADPVKAPVSGLQAALIDAAIISEKDKLAIKDAIQKLNALLKLLEEARQVERFMTIAEIRIEQNSNKQRVDDLDYNPSSNRYELSLQAQRETKSMLQPAFKIVNGRKFQDPEEFVTVMDAKEYRALQQLGATLNYRVQGELVDKAFTSQLIGEYGDYRRKLLYALVRREETTSTFTAKETICQHVMNRLMALQKLEAAYGGSIVELQKKLEEYKAEIARLRDETTAVLARISADKTLTKQQIRWFENIFKTYQDGLAADLQRADKLDAEIRAVLKKHPQINQNVELYLHGNDPHHTGLTKWVLANWLRHQANDIIGAGTLAADLVDISGKWGISSGQFSKAAANAMRRCNVFEFPEDGRMHPAYQGEFKGERYISSADLAHGQRDTRNVLFALIAVKAGVTTPEAIAELVAQIKPKSVTSRGWARLLCCSRSKQREEMNDEIAEAEVLTRAQLINQLYEELRERVQASNESFKHAFIKVFGYMWDATKSSAQGAWNGTKECGGRFVSEITRDYTYTTTVNRGADHHALVPFKGGVADAKADVDLELGLSERSLTPFHAWNPRTLYSVLDEFLIQFGGFFIKRYDAAPLIWTIGTVFGAMSGVTAYETAIPTVRKMLEGMQWSEHMIDKFIDMSIAISEATTESQMFQFIGTTTTIQQAITFMFLEVLAEGADASACQAILEAKRNLPVVAAVLFGATGFGYGLGQLSDFVKSDFGTEPVIAEFFSGLKVAGFLYESTLHEPGERSALANTVTSTVGLAGDALRAAASVGNLLLMPASLLVGRRDIAETAGRNFWRPWLALMDTSLGVLVSTLDATLRVGTTVAQGSAAVAKAGVVEVPFNTVAKFTPQCISEPVMRVKSWGKQKTSYFLTEVNNQTTRRIRRFYEERSLRAEPTAHQSVSMFGSRHQPKPLALEAPKPAERKRGMGLTFSENA